MAQIPVGISNRHLHLSQRDKEILFGQAYQFLYIKSLSQKGQYAAQETVTLIGPKGSIDEVRILGPERVQSQVEISRSDMYKLGVEAPVRESGDLEGTPGIVLVGPKGVLKLRKGLICAKRHIHMNEQDARRFTVSNGQLVSVRAVGERGLIFDQILIRVHESFCLELHLDIDEANAACLTNNDLVIMILSNE